MQEILNYLENSTLIANVVSFVVLGITGVLMRSIIVAIARITEQNKDIDEKQGLIKNLATIAKITYQTSLMYKNAIINSNLAPEAKNQALEIFNEVQTAYQDLLPLLDAIEGKVEEKTSAVTQAITEQFTQIGQDALSQLRNKLK
jgi:Na+-transporting NADH:ubiquinone oxidoreductase subunit NqrC